MTAVTDAFHRKKPSSTSKRWLQEVLPNRLCVSRISVILALIVIWMVSIQVDIAVPQRDGSSFSPPDIQHRQNSGSIVVVSDSSTQSGLSSPQVVSLANARGARGPQPFLRASDLPDASGWKASEDTPFEVCFVTSVYSATPNTSDRPPDVTEIQEANPSFRFFVFTNMPDLDAPGWTVKVKNFSGYRRYITQSRWAKFMGWKDQSVQGCQAVFYMDGYCGPKLKHSERYRRLAKAIRDSEFGLFQNQHQQADGPLEELDRIQEKRKDIAKNVEASKAWLEAQPDFRRDATIYENHYIGYNPKSTNFQRAAQFFWDRYSLEQDSWRDQPLWGYVLDHFHITPTRLGTFDALFHEYYRRMGHEGHRYNVAADSNAVNSGRL